MNYKNNGYLIAIKLDITSRDSKLGNTFSPEERKHYIDNKLYFKYGKLGYITNRYRKKKY
jgi:hypothetical protein